MTESDEPSLKRMWEEESSSWIAWARTPGHDAYWDYSPRFLGEIVPAPHGTTLEIGCGEGRVTRDLQTRGHDMFSIDPSPTLISAALDADPKGRYLLADAAALPFSDRSFGTVVAYNSLMDMDDMERAVREAARVLVRGGHLCICVTHPINDAGAFEAREADARFVIEDAYLTEGWFDQTFERAGMVMRFRGWTYPLESYFRAFEAAGLVIEKLREPAQTDEAVRADPRQGAWQRIPCFLFMRALKPVVSRT